VSTLQRLSAEMVELQRANLELNHFCRNGGTRFALTTDGVVLEPCHGADRYIHRTGAELTQAHRTSLK